MPSNSPQDDKETLIFVDIESSGPIPSQYSLLSIGACSLWEPRQSFYIELQPDSEIFSEQSMKVNHLSLEKLADDGIHPSEAMQRFGDWVGRTVPEGNQAVFAAFNAPFDWMFINDYFHRYIGHNPFGHKALDIKAYYMGMHNTSWTETSYKIVCEHYQIKRGLTHHALDDAIDAAKLFQNILADTENTQV